MSGINDGGAYERLPDGTLKRIAEPEPAETSPAPKKPLKEKADG